VLLVRRPKRGLLGGMLGLPTGPWTAEPDNREGAPAAADWSEAGTIEHVFTHFALSLGLLCAKAKTCTRGEIWWPIDRIEEAGLPSLFAKLARAGVEWSRAAGQRHRESPLFQQPAAIGAPD
jgi:A/G-specific adenine glycosylase